MIGYLFETKQAVIEIYTKCREGPSPSAIISKSYKSLCFKV